MGRIRRAHTRAFPQAEQVIRPHQPQPALMVALSPFPLQRRRKSSIPIAGQLQSKLLDAIAHHHISLPQQGDMQVAIEGRPADPSA
jgi:hypothetical protein